MANTIVADIIARFTVDKKSKAAVKSELDALEHEIAHIDKQRNAQIANAYKVLSQYGVKAESIAEGVADSFGVTTGEVQKIAKGLNLANANAENLEKTAKNTSNIMAQMALIFGGIALTRFGTGLLSPIAKANELFGATREETAAWAQQQTRLEHSIARIGITMQSQLLPALTKVADIVEDIANTFETNPVLAKLVTGGGVLAIGVGGLLTTLGQLLSVVVGLKFLASGGVFGAFAGGGAAAAAGGAGAAGLGATLIPAIAIAVAAAFQLGLLKLSDSIAGAIAKALGISYTSAGTRFRNMIGIGGGEEQTGEQFIPESAVTAFIAFQKAQADATLKYEEQRTAIVAAAGRERATIEERYEQVRIDLANAAAQFAKSQATAAANFVRAEAQAEADYYRSRATLARRFNIEVQRAEEDHQRNLRRMRRDHQERVAELEGQRDAVGIVLEQRRYERERQEAEEDYRIASKRRSEDFALQLAEMESQFAAARAQRLANFQAQQQEALLRFQEEQKLRLEMADTQRKADLAKLNQATTEKLRDLQKGYNAERIARVNAFNEQLRDLGVFLGAEYQAKATLYAAELALLRSYIAAVQAGGAIQGRAAGGPVMAGRAYIVGERRPELFVPNANGTIYPSVGAGRINLTQNIRYSGEVTSGSRREIAKIAREAAFEGISAALGAA